MAGEYYEHITAEGERWDTVAYAYYGDPLLYHGIIAANPQVPIIPLLPSGIVLRVPVIALSDTLTAEELPPWKR
jgi:phage tail protein X